MKGDNIAARLRAFASGVVKLCRDVDGDASTKHIVRQLVRAATSGGANYEEARGAESRADELIAILTASIRTAKGRLEAARLNRD